MGLALLAHVTGGDERQRLRLDVQPGDGDVDRDPLVAGASAEEKPLLGVEDLAVAGGVAEALAALAGEAEPVGHRPVEQFGAAAAGEALGHGVDGQQAVGVGVEQEQGVSRLVEKRLT